MKYTLFFSQIQFDFLPNSELLIHFLDSIWMVSYNFNNQKHL